MRRAHLAEDDVLDADVEDDEEGQCELEDEDFALRSAAHEKLLGFEVEEDLVTRGYAVEDERRGQDLHQAVDEPALRSEQRL